MKNKRKTWPTSKEDVDRMAENQKNLMARGLTPAEKWASVELKKTGLKWKRERRWGFRIFDFWCSVIGVAVEVDGPEHDIAWDKFRDTQDFNRSGIIVLRIKNFNSEDLMSAIDKIAEIKQETWLERREKMGLLTKCQKIWLAEKRAK